MSLEEQRRANIARNEAKMKEFKLKELNSSMFGEQEKPDVAKKPASKPKPKRKQEPTTAPVQLRKSRRLQGVKLEPEFDLKTEEKPVAKNQMPQENWRREGEVQLKQLIDEGNWNKTLELMDSFGDPKLNVSDYFETIEPTDKLVKELRVEFGNLQLDPRDINITNERIFTMTMHPSAEKRVVVAGDKLGQVGIWDADVEEDEGLIKLDIHTRTVSALHFDANNLQKLYTGSYDGSIRLLDLSTQKSTEAFVHDSDPKDPVGISDFHMIDSNILYYTTLQGDFGAVDLRSGKHTQRAELHEKKIGGFSVNPNDSNQIATGSLDRTMKVWDIRKVDEPIGVYDSRLSISSTSWNTANQIVCNGYDDTINVFNVDKISEELTPDVRLKHNCQTGRWVSILKSKWQQNPKDGVQKFVIGNMKKYIDIFTGSGQQIAHLEGARTVPAVVALHRDQNWVVGGTASGKAYLFSSQE